MLSLNLKASITKVPADFSDTPANMLLFFWCGAWYPKLKPRHLVVRQQCALYKAANKESN
jgi:hypothetical protein